MMDLVSEGLEVVAMARSRCRGQIRGWAALWLAVWVPLSVQAGGQEAKSGPREPERHEQIEPISIESLHARVNQQRRQGGNPRQVNGYLMFDGAGDGNLQVDPQIAVGPKHVVHATNTGITVYDKQGNYLDGVNQNGFNGGIDPKLYFDAHRGVFGFDLWSYWEPTKPVNIAVSVGDDPTDGWHVYPVPAPEGRDGGAIGFSHDWIGYSFPGGSEQTFVVSATECIQGQPATVYHFSGNLGHPVNSMERRPGLLFVDLNRCELVIREVAGGPDGTPVVTELSRVEHGLEFAQRPPAAPQPGTDARVAAGDNRPKNIMLQADCLWFSHTVNCDGRAAVQWHQVRLDGTFVQSGILRDDQNSYIQTSLAVNRRGDVVVGFQEAGPQMFVSPRFAYRLAGDPAGQLRPMVSMGEGQAATKGGPWGDYSGSAVDGGNGLDLWTVQSVAGEDGRNDTVIARIELNSDSK